MFGKKYTRYEHHGVLVWVLKKLKGKHRKHCLCYRCANFAPGELANCYRAQVLYQFCRKYDMVTPVYECPIFEEEK